MLIIEELRYCGDDGETEAFPCSAETGRLRLTSKHLHALASPRHWSDLRGSLSASSARAVAAAFQQSTGAIIHLARHLQTFQVSWQGRLSSAEKAVEWILCICSRLRTVGIVGDYHSPEIFEALSKLDHLTHLSLDRDAPDNSSTIILDHLHMMLPPNLTSLKLNACTPFRDSAWIAQLRSASVLQKSDISVNLPASVLSSNSFHWHLS